VGPVLVQQQMLIGVGKARVEKELPDTLLGFETTGLLSLRPVWETGGGGSGCRLALVVGCGV
jgi:hypothetical protein